jgi:transcriptional regulator with XRE-family HTH domain
VNTQVSKVFGNNVRQLRIANGLTQEALAETAHCHANYIGGIERGERNCTLEIAAAIAHALRTDLSDLVRGIS